MAIRSGWGESFGSGRAGGGTTSDTGSFVGSSGAIVYVDSSGALNTDPSNLYYDSTAKRVGIGTSAPAGPLHISRTTDELARFESSVANGAYLRFMDGTTAKLFVGWGPNTIVGASTQNGAIAAQGLALSGNAGAAQNMYVSTLGSVGIGTTAPSGPFEVYSGTTQVMTLTTLNRVGIGTTNPQAPLQVASTVGVLLSTGTAKGLMFADGNIGIVAISSNQLQFNVPNGMARLTTVGLQISGAPGGVNNSSALLHLRTTVNGNVFLVEGSTVVGTPAFCIQSTGSTSKVGFWSTGGTTRMPAISTVAVGGSDTASLRTAVNDLIAVFQAFGQTA